MRAWFVIVACTIAAGCAPAVYFPSDSLPEAAAAVGAQAAYAPHGKGAEVFFYAAADGRYDRIGLDLTGDARPDRLVDLDAIRFAQCRHLVIVLDGFGYEVVKQYYDEGHLRLFHAPSRVIAPYPTLTDLCIEDMLGYMPCPAMEAMYYDHRLNRTVGGSLAYLQGRNEPYAGLFGYKASLIADAIGYVMPWRVFESEVGAVKTAFDRRRTQEMLAYVVSSAGVSTAEGAAGQRRCLQRVEQLCNQVVWETQGLTKITLTADHGHSYTPSTRIDLEGYLASKGYRVRDSLEGPRDVVYIRFGLETYASFCTHDPAALARDLAAADGVDLASYADGDKVVVLKRTGKGQSSQWDSLAMISRIGGRYKYDSSRGDPLELKGVLAKLHADDQDCYDADELFAATAEHKYPDPLARLWRAHFALVENPPDVIVSLENRYYSGSRAFGGSVNVASTHGALDRSNSTTFIMSTAGALPPAMRSGDIPAAMKSLTGVAFPRGR